MNNEQNVLERIGNCDFDADFLKKIYWGYAVAKNRWFKSHVRNRHKIGDEEVELITNECKSRDLRVVKLIRLRRLELFQKMRNQGMSVKVIHLVRDPRAILSSRIKKNWISDNPHTFKHHARLLCRYMMEKYEVGEDEIIKRIYFEDWATDTDTGNEDIYDFIGKTLDASTKVYNIS